MAQRLFNFSPGPAVLPEPVLRQIQQEMLVLPGAGTSILEISHRSSEYLSIHEEAQANLRTLLSIPDEYSILFLQGGSRLQFSMVPLNLLGDGQVADYVLTGSWGRNARKEASKIGQTRIAWDGSDSGYARVPDPGELDLDPQAAYVHVTSNETIEGVQFPEDPVVEGVPLVSDASSDFLSRPIPVPSYGLIYACAQKNAGPAGLTVVILRKELLERGDDNLPGYLSYRTHDQADSLWNTPPTFAIYVLVLVTRWISSEFGSLETLREHNRAKAQILYDHLDAEPDFYLGHATGECRSQMNVTFRLPDDELTKRFLTEAESHGLCSLKGHRSVGGIRASIYNAMPLAGVEALGQFMGNFANHCGT